MIRIVQLPPILSPHNRLRYHDLSVIVSKCKYTVSVVAQSILRMAETGSVSARLFGDFIFFKYSLCLLFIGCFFHNHVWAEVVVSHDSGIYVGGRAGYSYNNRSCVDAAVVCDRDDLGVGVFVGYDVNPVWALELSLNDLGDTAAVYPGITLDGEIQSTDFSLMYSREFYKRTTIFGKLGVAYWHAEVVGWGRRLDDYGASPLLGGGLQVPLFNQRKLYGRLEYQYVDRIGSREMGYANAHFFSAGLIWHFGAVLSSTRSRSIESSPTISNAASDTAPISAHVSAAKAAPSKPIELAPALIIDEQAGTPLFAVGSSVIQNKNSIDPIVSLLMKNPNTNVLVLGHTDSQGSTNNNLRLSALRAQAVADYLEERGIAFGRIQTQGVGEDKPLTDNLSEASRAKNRRVEFLFSNPEKH